MELDIVHEIAASLARVEAAVLGPALLQDLPRFAAGVARVRVLRRREDGDRIEREAVYTAAFIPAPLSAVIPRAWTTWIEHTEWDLRGHAARFRVEPQLPAALRRRVRCCGDYRLRALTADRTGRRITGVLEIFAPGVGRRAEAVLARVIAQQFAGEAALLAVLTRGPT